MPRNLHLSLPIVEENRTASRPFQDYLREMSDAVANVIPPYSNNSGTPYTIAGIDANTVIRFTAANPAVTIPTNAAVPFAIGTLIGIRQAGTGTLVLTTTSLTINGTVPSWAQHNEVHFRKVGDNEWDVI